MCNLSTLEVWISVPQPGERRGGKFLDYAELAVLERLRSSQAKASYLRAHVQLRFALTAFDPGTPPEAWRFTRTATGRSVVTGAAEPPCFSLSRTPSLVGCSVAARLPHGLDVVDVDPRVEAVERVALSREERAQLAGMTLVSRRKRLAALWALKEAYVKARGLGLALPVDQVSFRLSAEAIEPEFGVAVGDDPAHWWFGLWRPAAGSILALAVERLGGLTPSFVWRRMSYENLMGGSISASSTRPPLLASTSPRALTAPL
jgi:4'-phosphopantetheinyl transferase